MLRYHADLRSLAFMLLTSSVLVAQWWLGTLNWGLFPLSLYLAAAVAVMAHNHNHVPMWRVRLPNVLTDYWLTLFYGYPAFAWIPTHNQNHHHFNNQEGDYTKTWRYTERNNLATLLSYPSISSYHQQKPIRAYLKMLRNRGRGFWLAMGQYLALLLFVGGALLIDWKKTLLFIVVPQQFGLFSVLIFNYIQHVHAEEESAWNHSRNFVGRGLNLLLFNNGFHTIHHERAGLHWSKTPAAHAKISHLIDPSLNESNLLWYLVRVYILAPINPRWKSRSLRAERRATSVR
jgi:beta-carotene hydroxylase